jgi:hypothetical protein
MTYNSYLDELAWIADMILICEDEMIVATKLVNNKRIGNVRYSNYLESSYRRKHIAEKYRAKLVRWFWNSRLGNPPTP